jgi:hypothetical protein
VLGFVRATYCRPPPRSNGGGGATDDTDADDDDESIHRLSPPSCCFCRCVCYYITQLWRPVGRFVAWRAVHKTTTTTTRRRERGVANLEVVCLETTSGGLWRWRTIIIIMWLAVAVGWFVGSGSIVDRPHSIIINQKEGTLDSSSKNEKIRNFNQYTMPAPLPLLAHHQLHQWAPITKQTNKNNNNDLTNFLFVFQILFECEYIVYVGNCR